MHWKLFSLIAVLMLVTTAASPRNVEAQSLVEMAIFMVVGVGNDETAEIILGPGVSQAKPQMPPISPGNSHTLIFVVTNPGDATCTQTIEKALLEPTIFGLPMGTVVFPLIKVKKGVDKGFGFIQINNDDPITLDGCFPEELQRVVVQMGDKVPPYLADQLAANPGTVPAGSLKVLSGAIVGTNGNTITVINNHLKSKG